MQYKGILKRIGYSTLIALVLACAVFGWYVPPQPVSAAPADAYWVGDGGNWSDALNHWAIVSGGAPGAGNLPDATSNVHFDANSFTVGGQTVTLDVTADCLSIDWTGATNTPELVFNGYLRVYGDATFISSMSMSGGSPYQPKDSGTLTTGGQILPLVYMYMAAGADELVLADELTVSGYIRWRRGILTTGNNNINCAEFRFNDAESPTLNLGSSTINCTSVTGGVPATVNAGTSIIKVTGTGAFAGAGKTYNNVELNGTAHTISGSNTFNSVTIANTATVTLGATTSTTGDWDNSAGGTIVPNTSTITVTGTGGFDGGGETYNIVNLNGTAHTITGDNTFASLTNAGTSTLTLGATTQTTGAWINSGAVAATTGTIIVTGTGVFTGGGETYNNVELNGTAHTISGSNTFDTLSLVNGSAQTITFTDGTTQTIATPNLSGSPGNIHTLQGSGAAGWNITQAGGSAVSLDYLNVSNSTASPPLWDAGYNSIDGGGNSGWIFSRGQTIAFQMLQSALTLVLAAGIIVVVIKTTNNPVTMLLEVVIGIIAIVIVLEMIF